MLNLNKKNYAFTGYLESDIIWNILEQCKMSLKVVGTFTESSDATLLFSQALNPTPI